MEKFVNDKRDAYFVHTLLFFFSPCNLQWIFVCSAFMAYIQ